MSTTKRSQSAKSTATLPFRIGRTHSERDDYTLVGGGRHSVGSAPSIGVVEPQLETAGLRLGAERAEHREMAFDFVRRPMRLDHVRKERVEARVERAAARSRPFRETHSSRRAAVDRNGGREMMIRVPSRHDGDVIRVAELGKSEPPCATRKHQRAQKSVYGGPKDLDLINDPRAVDEVRRPRE